MKYRFRSIMYALTLACGLVLVAATVIGAAASDNDWRLMVKSAACVQGPDVLLGEIADPVSGVDARTWNTLSAIKLWKASSKQGRPVTVDRTRLRKILKHYMGNMVDNLVLPSQLTVQTGGKVITREELRSQVVAFLTPRAKDLGGEMEIKNLQLPLHYFFKNRHDKLIVAMDEDLKPGRNRIKFKIQTPDGKVFSTKAGTVFLNIWKAVPVAVKPMNRNERVTRESVTFKRVNLAYKSNVWDGAGGPWRMVRTLGRGQPFTMAHLELVPLIEKGERVNLIYRNKRVQLSIKVEALGEGGRGQQVSVRNLQSKRTIVATVVDDNTVVVR